jgi:hypothetical protein
MVRKFKPTSVECTIIRDCAKRSSGHKAVKCEPGIRTNIEKDGIPRSINIAEVSDHPDWDDTDLWSTTDWSDFRERATLTDDGRGIFDFYVYSLGYHGELETNVVAYYEGGKLVRVTGVCDGVMWRQPVDSLAGYHDGQSAVEHRSRGG